MNKWLKLGIAKGPSDVGSGSTRQQTADPQIPQLQCFGMLNLPRNFSARHFYARSRYVLLSYACDSLSGRVATRGSKDGIRGCQVGGK